MCGRYAIFTEEDNEEIRQIINEINERYKNSAVKPECKTGEIFPTDRVPAFSIDINGRKKLKLFKWGFPGFGNNNSVIINARSETLNEKPAFRKLLCSNRCLLPASAFYEWKKTENKKEKYLISAKDRKAFYMAGLYNRFVSKDGVPFDAFVIITTSANSSMSELHDRMPVIMDKSYGSLWLSPDMTDFKEIKSLLAACSPDLIQKKVS